MVTTGSQWITNDILNIQVQKSSNGQYIDMFYSISKNKIVGYIEGVLAEIFSIGNQILAFEFQTNGFYIFQLDMDASDKINDEDIKELFPILPYVPEERPAEGSFDDMLDTSQDSDMNDFN